MWSKAHMGSKAGRRFKRPLFIIGMVAFIAVFAGLAGPWASSAQALSVTTPYPALTVPPGQQITLDLQVLDTVTGRADLSVVGAPTGWKTTILGGGRPVTAVITNPTSPPSLQLQVEVPKDAAKGDYTLAVQAHAASGTATLPVTFTVNEQAGGTTTLTSDYTSLRGPASAAFSFNLTLTNNRLQERTYNIVANGPTGWKLSLHPSGSSQETPTVAVQPQGTVGLTLDVTPATDAKIGKYNVTVTATGGGEEVIAPMVVEITGTYTLVLTTPDGRLNANVKAGTTTRVPMIVQNQGSGPLQGIQLSATPPANWEVTSEPATIDTLPANQQQTVTAIFKPAKDAIAGDYVVTMSARADQASSSVDFRVTVKTSTLWGLVGILVAVAAIGILILIFRRFGHR
jgi:uncharacterized membrane protein